MIRLNGHQFLLSVRQLVEFLLRSGDIDQGSTGTRDPELMQLGTKAHSKLQKSRSGDYKAEVPLEGTFPLVEREGETWTLQLSGRADGVYHKDGLTAVEEIKGMAVDVTELTEPVPLHLYQAMCYVWLLLKDTDWEQAIITMTYVTLNVEGHEGETKTFEQLVAKQELSEWFSGLLTEYGKFAGFVLDHRKTRNATLLSLPFPYPYRKGQEKLCRVVYDTIRQKGTIFLQAPTGTGKTLSVLFAAFNNMARSSIDKLFYLTAKTAARSAAKEAVNILQKTGGDISYISLTARDKCCVLPKRECRPEVCPRAKGHYDRVLKAVETLLSETKSFDPETILEGAERFSVCPFELSLDLSYWVDVVIGDYAYALDPNVRLARFFGGEEELDCALLIDESHNLLERSREMYSAMLSTDQLLKLLKVFNKKDKRLSLSVKSLFDEIINVFPKTAKKEYDEGRVVILGSEEIEQLYVRASRCMDSYLFFARKYPELVSEETAECFFMLRDFCGRVEDQCDGYLGYKKTDEDGRTIVKFLCVSPHEQLRGIFNRTRGNILFSATLQPMSYFLSLLSGRGKEDFAFYIPSPFPEKNRRVVVVQDISLKYSERTDRTYDKITGCVMDALLAKPGHYMVFTPSYAMAGKIHERIRERMPFLTCLLQEPGMTEKEQKDFLNTFLDPETYDQMLLGICVMGGAFSEGINLPGKALIGTLIVGCGYPMRDRERDLLTAYFDERRMDGFSHMYRYPGLNKVLQAAGRVIRTEEDCGVIVLIDSRFCENKTWEQLPGEWKDLVLTESASLSKVLSDFWQEQEKGGNLS